MIRYRLRVSKDEVTFGQVLSHSIERWYESDSHFARMAGVSSSAVSRWCAGSQVPKPETIEKMAPHIKDDRGRPYTAASLLALAYPGLGRPNVGLPAAPTPVRPLVRDIERMLAEDSPVPQDKRATLETLLETIVAPYRVYLRKRKAS